LSLPRIEYEVVSKEVTPREQEDPANEDAESYGTINLMINLYPVNLSGGPMKRLDELMEESGVEKGRTGDRHSNSLEIFYKMDEAK
jgi:hypothetical protein